MYIYLNLSGYLYADMNINLKTYSLKILLIYISAFHEGL